MLLLKVKKEGDWIESRWDMTYRTGWDQILQACKASFDYYEQLQILVENKQLDIHSKEELATLKEAFSFTFRGISTILKVPVMITFYNQSSAVDVVVAATDEFSAADYESVNRAMCKYLDSIELAMHR